MNLSSQLTTLVAALAGQFDNQAQSLAEPIWYVHLNTWHRPIPAVVPDGIAVFMEQQSMVPGQLPYRQRVVWFQETQDGIMGQFYALKQPTQFRGGGADPTRLASMSLDDLHKLPGCCLQVKGNSPTESYGNPNSSDPMIFNAEMLPNTQCGFIYEEQVRYVQLGFQLTIYSGDPATAVEFWSYDRGINPDTGQILWGAMMGPFKLNKIADYGFSLSKQI